ncbi:MAG TPA: SPASM domain-containing protein [Tepidisphaeraceae bacterium]
MNNVTAVLSMLHEQADINSATRRFREQPVLSWTLHRLRMSQKIASIAILCWEDQADRIQFVADDAQIINRGERKPIASLQSVAASRRWADGWRGGLLWTCDFDLGFYGPAVKQIIERFAADAVLLIDPSAGLVDAKILDQLIERADSHEEGELIFTQAAPGLAGALARPLLVDRLTQANTHPGRILHYLPDQPVHDPITTKSCVAVATPLTRTSRNFRLDSDRQIQRLTHAAINLNGELIGSDAEQLLQRLEWSDDVDQLPREIVLELNTDRATSPIFWPGKHQCTQRAPISVAMATQIFQQIANCDDIRLTFAGVGDPLLHENFFEILDAAKNAGIRAIHVETDLLPNEPVERLADSEVDVVSVHLPALARATYAAVMGVDRFVDAIENIKRLVTRRHERISGVPILVPTFVKCQINLGEMEQWYDQWLKALGAAVITGPSEFAGLIPNCGVGDMSPPKRRPCARLWSRMTILSDGKIVACEQDVSGRQMMGDVGTQSISQVWREKFIELRAAHKSGVCNAVCGACKEWHRP